MTAMAEWCWSQGLCENMYMFLYSSCQALCRVGSTFFVESWSMHQYGSQRVNSQWNISDWTASGQSASG